MNIVNKVIITQKTIKIKNLAIKIIKRVIKLINPYQFNIQINFNKIRVIYIYKNIYLEII